MKKGINLVRNIPKIMQLSDCQSIGVDTKGGNNVIMQSRSSRHANYTNDFFLKGVNI